MRYSKALYFINFIL